MVVHGGGAGGAAIAGHIDGEDVEAGVGEGGHPTVVLDVEGNFSGVPAIAGTVDRTGT
jgi:hypothetical protein